MADTTVAPVPTGASEFDVPGDLQALADHFGGSGMFKVATIATLPLAAANWPGRQLYVEEDKSFRIWDAGTSQWLTTAELGSAWVPVTPESAYYNVVANGSYPALSVRRTGQLVELNGHISTDGNTGNDSTWAYIPAGYRPSRQTPILMRPIATGTFVFAAYVNTAGSLVVQSNITSGAATILAQAVWLTV